MRKRIVLVLLSVVAVVSGCGGRATEGDRETVAAAFYPLAFAASAVGAPRVVDLTPPGAEPHDLELTPDDVRLVRDARLVLYLGAGFQPALEDALEERSGRSLDLLPRQTLAGEDGLDPHVWLDPTMYTAIVSRVAEALGDPAAAAPVVTRLRALDRAFERGLASCERRDLVTTHAAFGHLARRYRLRQVALAGLEPEAEPGPRDIERIVDTVRQTGATTIFVEPLIAPDLAQAVAREVGVSTATLDPVESQVDPARDYFAVMRSNLVALRQALGCG